MGQQLHIAHLRAYDDLLRSSGTFFLTPPSPPPPSPTLFQVAAEQQMCVRALYDYQAGGLPLGW